MNAFRQVLAEGALKFADSEGAQNSKVKLDKLVDSFRAAWKDWKEKEDKKSAVDVFMEEMDNDFGIPSVEHVIQYFYFLLVTYKSDQW